MKSSEQPSNPGQPPRRRRGEAAYDLADFRDQIAGIRRLGSLQELVGQVPGLKEAAAGLDLDAESKRIIGMIDSMTPAERHQPALIGGSRRRRIARGAGVETAQVAGLLKQFEAMAAMIQHASAERHPGRAPASPPGLDRALVEAWNRDLLLWNFVADT